MSYKVDTTCFIFQRFHFQNLVHIPASTTEVFQSFPYYRHKCLDSTANGQQLLPSTSLPIHYWLIILSGCYII